jgi:hypothetical protein
MQRCYPNQVSSIKCPPSTASQAEFGNAPNIGAIAPKIGAQTNWKCDRKELKELKEKANI